MTTATLARRAQVARSLLRGDISINPLDMLYAVVWPSRDDIGRCELCAAPAAAASRCEPWSDRSLCEKLSSVIVAAFAPARLGFRRDRPEPMRYLQPEFWVVWVWVCPGPQGGVPIWP